ncbi:unnamed protein product [Owenia fusiformis]|uniref:Uncharacterized protein n=1 Tax=Owenia fusiformis TaxID=6347 RepID=A0A8J1XT61_OWEFU|nr:unnamed protein product [Owenia fusiformis]
MDVTKQFQVSCEQGDLNQVELLLEQVEVDWADTEGVTGLHISAANGHENIVRLLITRGAALDKSNTFGWTALMQASRHGHTNIIALLLQHQADIYARNRLGANALTLAARGGHLQTVKFLVEAGLDISNCGAATCEVSALMVTTQNGHDAVVRYLLDRGSDVNYRMPSIGLNALMVAALNGHMTTAQILIEGGADPNLTNINNATALAIATKRGKREVKGYLDRKTTNKPQTDCEDNKPDIIDAAKSGDIERIRAILEMDPSQRDACSPADGATPLMFAAMTGRKDIAQLLVERGCDINKQDVVSGWTALMQATYHGKKNIAVYLTNVGVDVNIQAKNGCTAFDMASLIDDVDTDLLRLLAQKATQQSQKSDNKKKAWLTHSETALRPVEEKIVEEETKSGLKGWWNRMSNRFRNLKIGRTFSTNRLTPLPDSAIEETMTKSQSSPMINTMVTNLPASNNNETSGLQMLNSYQTLMLETKKSASMYTLTLNPPHQHLSSSETLKPVIPPFLPSPTFDLTHNDRSPMSQNGGTLGKNTMPPTRTNSMNNNTGAMKLLQNHKNSSPSGSYRFYSNISPGSSAGGSSVSRQFLSSKMQKNSAFKPSGVDRQKDQMPPPRIFMPASQLQYSGPPSYLSNSSQLKTRVNGSTASTTSPSSSTSGSSAQTLKSGSRKKDGSTTSTLTPSPSPTPNLQMFTVEKREKGQSDPGQSSKRTSLESDEDDISQVLSKLSLECYKPIFEEQEVDMEAFLTLTEADLRELGIDHSDSRRQILTAITHLSSGKGRERDMYQSSMGSYSRASSTKSSHH